MKALLRTTELHKRTTAQLDWNDAASLVDEHKKERGHALQILSLIAVLVIISVIVVIVITHRGFRFMKYYLIN